jgi:dipeptidyl aminopeptidase/acylaminoacyl peptidase
MTAKQQLMRGATLIPLDILFGNPQKSTPLLSDDGKYLAYLAPGIDNVLNVWVRSHGKTDDRMVTADTDRGVRLYYWRPDSKHVIYLQDSRGDENWHILQTNVETCETKDLTPSTGVQYYIVDIKANHHDVILISSNKRDPHVHDVYRLNLNDGTMEEDTINPGDVSSWTADNDLTVRAATVFCPDGSTEIRMRDNSQSEWRTFMTWGADESDGGILGFTPDGQGVYLTSSVGANARRLLEVSLKDGKQTVLAEDREFDVSQAITHPTRHHVQAVNYCREKSEWTALCDEVKDDFAYLDGYCQGIYGIISRTLNDEIWIVQDVVDNGSMRFYAYDRRRKAAELIFLAQAKLDEYSLARMQPISYTARDGMKIYGYLTLPVGIDPRSMSKKPPLVLDVHGGPWERNVWCWDSQVQWLANRGYSVLQINFRGSTGYGKKYYTAGDREWGGKMHDDLIDGKRWAVAQGYADSSKVAICGWSYGGYATLVGLAFTPDEFCCGVDIVGPSNLVSLLETIPPYWAPIKSLFDKRVGILETEREFLESRSPLFKVHQVKAPLLIAQGAQDPRVKKAESDQIVKALRENGQEVEYLVIEDEGHGFAKPENRLRFYALAEEFLAKQLGGRRQSPPGE